jgi:CBS domain-containing protein
MNQMKVVLCEGSEQIVELPPYCPERMRIMQVLNAPDETPMASLCKLAADRYAHFVRRSDVAAFCGMAIRWRSARNAACNAKEMAMQMVSEVMTRNVRFVSPQEDVQHAAQMMGELDVGVLPVCEGDRLVGMVTDRDITLRSTAVGKSPRESHVEEVMSRDVRWCFEDQPLDEVMIQMADSQIRRVPVVTHDDQHRLIGIVALGDIATRTEAGPQKADVEQVVEMVSSPSDAAQGQQAGGGGTTAAGSGAGAEGGDADAVYAGQADAGDTSLDEGATKPGAATGASASGKNASLADGTGADRTADTDVQAAGQQADSMSPAEAGQAISGGGDGAAEVGGVSLADGTGAATEGGDAGASDPAADKTENMRSGPT